MTDDGTDYAAAATATFQQLKPLFQASTNFWQLGHTFDTVIDYLANVSADDAPVFGGIARERYRITSDPMMKSACLYDDYGWWGLASLRASGFAPFRPEDREQFERAAHDCWNIIDIWGAAVWEKADRKVWAQLEPRHPGGVWNCSFAASEVDGDCATPCNPLARTDAIRGFQNTVTNTLALDLSTRMWLSARSDESKARYRASADRQFGFLKAWFADEGSPQTKVEPLLFYYAAPPDGGAPDRCVVRERVSAYADGSTEDVLGFQSKLAWAGDQGLLLGGLVSMMKARGPQHHDYPLMLTVARQLLTGIQDYLVAGGLLQAWAGGDAPAGDKADYLTGIASCMRYLLYAWQQGEALRPAMDNDDFKAFVRRNADAAAERSRIDRGDMTDRTNDLATLVLAKVVGV
ncbi:hypothetical protein ACFOGJ_28295 [Marinibaculum pumilum]|uniref:Glycosyl hydrolase n=1 Tax=Marinibaculum pumilum TaxID=1766165 RepID=A0ABV7LAA9_9PROT